MASSTSSSGPLWNALGEFLKQPTSSAFKDWETEVLKVLWDNDIRNQKTFNMLSEQHFESIGFSSVGKRLELVSLQSKGVLMRCNYSDVKEFSHFFGYQSLFHPN